MAETELSDSGAEVMRTVARAVVAHESLRSEAQGGEVSRGVLEESERALMALVGHDLSEGEAPSIIDADMDIFDSRRHASCRVDRG